jgi:hypothetical protein
LLKVITARAINAHLDTLAGGVTMNPTEPALSLDQVTLDRVDPLPYRAPRFPSRHRQIFAK